MSKRRRNLNSARRRRLENRSVPPARYLGVSPIREMLRIQITAKRLSINLDEIDPDLLREVALAAKRAGNAMNDLVRAAETTVMALTPVLTVMTESCKLPTCPICLNRVYIPKFEFSLSPRLNPIGFYPKAIVKNPVFYPVAID